MLRTNTSLWRIAFLSGLGSLPAGCGARVDHASSDSSGTPGAPDPNGASPANSPSTDAPILMSPQQSACVDNPLLAGCPSTTAPLSEPTACLDSVPDVEHGIDTGLERCADGRRHRPVVVQCTSTLPRESGSNQLQADAGSDAGPGSILHAGTVDASTGLPSCTSDRDCTAKPYGYCGMTDTRPSIIQCQYGCVQDADCGRGFLCQCGDPVGTCVPAECRSDADCGSGMLCADGSGSRTLGCDTSYTFVCETPQDRCRIDQDCPSTQWGSYCASSRSGRLCVAYSGAVCGRPFIVAGSPRLAGVAQTSEWLGSAGRRPDCSALSSTERRTLVDAWTRLGLMEHASVAAFARFTLQLLHLGAPFTLVEQSQQAMADELTHARMCFGLASAYAGTSIGPGPLPTEHALDQSSLEDVVVLTLHEGCVGETIAALEASEALALTHDPIVRETWARIEADERRHAELAWRFVIWALRAGDARLQSRVQRELHALSVSAAEHVSHGQYDAAFDSAAHGILSLRRRLELRTAALRDVVLPCAQVLLPAI